MGRIVIGGYEIIRGEIPLFLTTEFWGFYEHWENFHVLKVLPHGGGTLGENPWTVKVIKEFEKANEMIIIEEQQKMMAREKANSRNAKLRK